jgi:phospholipid/cholesterol/gamma-HCH transport system substrate-binding protein
MTDQTKNILIGLFVAAAITIMIGMILFLEPTIGDGKKALAVRFANVAGISVGTRVTFAGKPVGEITRIREVANARGETPDESGRVYIYELSLKVDSSVEVYEGDEIAVKTTGLMGERSVAILPKATPKGKIGKPITHEVIFANSIDPLENTFNHMTRLASKMEGSISRLDKWFDDNQRQLTNAIQSFGGAMNKVDAVLTSVDQEELISAFRKSLSLLDENMQFIKRSLDDDQLLYKISNLAEKLNQTAAAFNSDGSEILSNINQISHGLRMGSGTLGRLISGDDFYLRLTSLLNKGETLLNDVNHYGLLFQYDKGWQRSRTKKANLLKALDTPQEFRTYFEGEIDSMTTSLGRLTELFERAAGSEGRMGVLQSDAFKSGFAALMRKVEGLSDSLKLYNQELLAEDQSKKP